MANPLCARPGCGKKKGKKYARRKYCGSCQPAVKREARDRAHRTYVAKTYNMQPGDYDRLYKAQGGRCALCQRATGARKKLAVDHDHACCKEPPTCGKCTRGLLCGTCNKTLGHSRDDPEFFERGAAYLRQPPAKEVF